MANAYLLPNRPHRLIINAEWNEKDAVKSIPGSGWDPNGKYWHVPQTWAAASQLRGIFGKNFTASSDVADWMWAEYHNRIQPSMGLRDQEIPSLDPVPDTRYAKLYPYQQVAVEWLTQAGSALLGDDMGTGKTVQILSALAKISVTDGIAAVLTALVICPNSVKPTWAKEAAIWFPDAHPYVVAGTALQRMKILDEAQGDPCALVIVNYESAPRLSRLTGYGSIPLKQCQECNRSYGVSTVTAKTCEVHPKPLNEFPWRTLIVDEAHRIKDPHAKQTRAIWALADTSSIRRRFGLTGTVIANSPDELWSVMRAIEPAEYPTKSKFVDRYCQAQWNAFGGMDITGLRPDTKEEFFQFFDPRWRRMTKTRVLPQLPPKIRQVRMVEMAPKQAKAYREMESTLLTRLDNGELLIARDNLTASTRLLQFSSSYATFDPQGDVQLTDPSPKIDELLVILEEMGTRQVVVCAEQRKLIELASRRLTKEKIEHVLITGQVPELVRAGNLEAFQSGKVRVLMFTMKAGGTGLTMTAADTIVFLQRSWSMIDNRQSTDRVHRIGSEIHDSVTVIDIITQGTVEETQLQRLHHKEDRLEEINRDREFILRTGAPRADLEKLNQEETDLMHGWLGEPL
jgi:SNF2 family DNA or RNA helicase